MDIILLSHTAMILFRAGASTGVKDRYIKFTLSAGTYSVDYFNTNIKKSSLQQEQDWETPQIKDLNLVIPEHYRFIAS